MLIRESGVGVSVEYIGHWVADPELGSRGGDNILIHGLLVGVCQPSGSVVFGKQVVFEVALNHRLDSAVRECL